LLLHTDPTSQPRYYGHAVNNFNLYRRASRSGFLELLWQEGSIPQELVIKAVGNAVGAVIALMGNADGRTVNLLGSYEGTYERDPRLPYQRISLSG
jgi:hypothetical protein